MVQQRHVEVIKNNDRNNLSIQWFYVQNTTRTKFNLQFWPLNDIFIF